MFKPWCGHYIELLGEMIHSENASLHPGVYTYWQRWIVKETLQNVWATCTEPSRSRVEKIANGLITEHFINRIILSVTFTERKLWFSFRVVMLMQYFADDHVCICYTATMFLEFWKRRQAEIAYEWDLLGYEDEEVRY